MLRLAKQEGDFACVGTFKKPDKEGAEHWQGRGGAKKKVEATATPRRARYASRALVGASGPHHSIRLPQLCSWDRHSAPQFL